MMLRRTPYLLAAATLLLLACDQSAPTSFASAKAPELPYGDGPVSPTLDSINSALRARGVAMQIARAEVVDALDHTDRLGGQVIFANDRAKRLETRWVAGDARRNADGDHLTWLDLSPFMVANTAGGPATVAASTDAAFATWGRQTCSTLQLIQRPWGGTTNPSAILDIGLPGNPFEADISVIGFLPASIFDAVLGPGASESVLGVTFTFVFIDANGNPTDINHDGKDDTALKETWFNNGFRWTTSGTGSDIDVQTVALHEFGHALELGHFGKIFGTLGNLKLHVSPRAAMNAIILGTLRAPLGTDEAAFCGDWASWPK